MRQTSNVLYIAVDSLIPLRGKVVSAFDEFAAALDHAGIPAVWLTSRPRLQLDEPRRKIGHVHPFIAEDGCGVYLPSDYFHLRPESGFTNRRKATTLRLGRFTCIPIAKQLPAASEALAELSEKTGTPIVTLSSLSPRELSQNVGLPLREAELVRQRDFDELFFFAGATPSQIEGFVAEGRNRGIEFRRDEALWSAAIGASTQRCVTTLSKLYDRALRYHASSVAVATPELSKGLFPACDRSILLSAGEPPSLKDPQVPSTRIRVIELHSPGIWEQLLESVAAKR